jgi:hypothetical protein
MIRVLDDLPDNVLGVEASGTVTDADYESVLIPAINERQREGGPLRYIYVLGEDFEGWTMGAMWEDAKLGGRAWEKVAVVTDKDWVTHAVKGLGWMIPGEVRVFGLAELDAAKEWAAG